VLFTWSHFCTDVTTPIISVRWVNTITSVSPILKLRHRSFDSLIAVHIKLFTPIRLQISVLWRYELAKSGFTRLACSNFVQTWPFISHSCFWKYNYLFLPKIGSRLPCSWLLPVNVHSAHAGCIHTGGLEGSFFAIFAPSAQSPCVRKGRSLSVRSCLRGGEMAGLQRGTVPWTSC